LCGRYWAKKILEWTGPEEVEEGSSPPQRALATAIYLNDKYSLDGRDPNGYVVRHIPLAHNVSACFRLPARARLRHEGCISSAYCAVTCVQGCQWAIGGLHDQGWQERPVFGKIRYMNYKGCQRKFDIPAYVRRIEDLAGETASGGSERAAAASKATSHRMASVGKKKQKKTDMPSISAPPNKKAKKVKAKTVDLF
jgi:deoxyribodipyrimidine photo-lyase